MNKTDTGLSWIPYSELTAKKRQQVDNKDGMVRSTAALNGLGLDKLVDDDDYLVRADVASRGYALDRLMVDEEPVVRARVAQATRTLDKQSVRRLAFLVRDENWLVRKSVVEQGYGLDRCVEDENWQVRRAVANQGYGLAKLVNDRNDQVKIAVAISGYGLDKLMTTGNEEVCEQVGRELERRGLSLEEWRSYNPAMHALKTDWPWNDLDDIAREITKIEYKRSSTDIKRVYGNNSYYSVYLGGPLQDHIRYILRHNPAKMHGILKRRRKKDAEVEWAIQEVEKILAARPTEKPQIAVARGFLRGYCYTPSFPPQAADAPSVYSLQPDIVWSTDARITGQSTNQQGCPSRYDASGIHQGIISDDEFLNIVHAYVYGTLKVQPSEEYLIDGVSLSDILGTPDNPNYKGIEGYRTQQRASMEAPKSVASPTVTSPIPKRPTIRTGKR